MEGFSVPNSLDNVRSRVVIQIIHKIFPPESHVLQSLCKVLTARYSLAVLSVGHRCIIAEEKLSVEQLNSHHGEDKKKENVDNENIKDVLERDHDTVEDSLESWDSVDHLERTKHTEKFHGLQLGSCGCASGKYQISELGN